VWPDLACKIGATVGTVRPAEFGDAARIEGLYTAGAHGWNCQSVRSEAVWQETRWLEQVWVLEDATDGLACSALVKIKRLERGQGKRVVVREIHGTCLEAQSSMVRSLAELEDVVRIELCLPPDSLFLHAFAEQFDISFEHELALRVLDVSRALRHLQPAEDLQSCISFEVADWVVDSEQPLKATVRVEDGAVEILDRHEKDPFRCDINTFTQLFSGGLSVEQAKAMNESPRRG